MKIIDKLTSRLFDLPSGFKISFDKSNPFLTAQGTISLPIVFPYTDTNVGILDNPIRYDRAEKLTIKRKVIIQAGPYQREATLAFTGGKRPTSFSAGYLNGTFLLDEAVFYNQMKDVLLNKVFEGIIRDDFTGTREEKIVSWVDYMEKIMIGEVSDDFDVFPVCYEVDGDGISIGTKNAFLNGLTGRHTAIKDGLSYFKLAGNYARTFVIDKADVSIPVGYEVTPFLKQSYVLRQIFANFGYVLSDDYLSKYSGMEREVLLNNTVDSLMLGTLNYSYLTPTKTINEYLNSIRVKYGCEFFLAANQVDVSLVFWNDVLDTVDLDMSKSIMDSPIVNCENQKTVQLTQIYTNKLSTVKYNSYHEMITAFGSLPVFSRVAIDVFSSPDEFVEQICFSQTSLRFYHIYDLTGTWDAASGMFDELGENLYDGYSTSAVNIEYMTFANPSEAVPMVNVGLSSTKDKISELPVGSCNMPYVGPVRNMTSTVVIDSKIITNSQVECPIMSCFRIGRMISNSTIFFGSTYAYTDQGLKVCDYNLVYNGPLGLLAVFWKKFDDVLRNSWQPMIFPVNLSIYQGLHWDPSKQKMFNGQPLVCEVLKYELSDAGVNVTEADFRTTKLYQ